MSRLGHGFVVLVVLLVDVLVVDVVDLDVEVLELDEVVVVRHWLRSIVHPLVQTRLPPAEPHV